VMVRSGTGGTGYVDAAGSPPRMGGGNSLSSYPLCCDRYCRGVVPWIVENRREK
jgi:hypothetical protein